VSGPGAIVLLHDGDRTDPFGDRRQTAATLPGILGDAKDAGYSFRALSELPRVLPTVHG
jgi:peptidoglycan/xylan/chitin deacetylase (PgdA/CDA1 family)